MDEETLREIVERRWPGGAVCAGPDEWVGALGYISDHAPGQGGDDGYWMDAHAPQVKELVSMLTAAVLAPELMALVEAARRIVPWVEDAMAHVGGNIHTAEFVTALAALPEELR